MVTKAMCHSTNRICVRTPIMQIKAGSESQIPTKDLLVIVFAFVANELVIELLKKSLWSVWVSDKQV